MYRYMKLARFSHRLLNDQCAILVIIYTYMHMACIISSFWFRRSKKTRNIYIYIYRISRYIDGLSGHYFVYSPETRLTLSGSRHIQMRKNTKC